MIEQIYMQLLDEGLTVRRPVPAYRIGASTYIVLRSGDFDASAETWEFPPGSIVDCEMRQTANGNVMTAVRHRQPDKRIA